MQCVSLKDKAWSGPSDGVNHLLMAVLNDPLFSIEFLFPMEQTFYAIWTGVPCIFRLLLSPLPNKALTKLNYFFSSKYTLSFTPPYLLHLHRQMSGCVPHIHKWHLPEGFDN